MTDQAQGIQEEEARGQTNPAPAEPAPRPARGGVWRFGLLAIALAVDQFTKYLARANFSGPDGMPDYSNVKQVLGEWLQLRLVYNPGAAFGLRPQSWLPFLNPTVFYMVFSLVAMTVLAGYYRKLSSSEGWQKTGVVLILSGAFGNILDRLIYHKVTDFIDVGIPGVAARWPTFNVADSCVCVGVGLILLAPLLFAKSSGKPVPAASSTTASNQASADKSPA